MQHGGECQHVDIRCLHGVEILWTWRRTRKGPSFACVACADCGEPLHGRVRPLICTKTGYMHH